MEFCVSHVNHSFGDGPKGRVFSFLFPHTSPKNQNPQDSGSTQYPRPLPRGDEYRSFSGNMVH